MNAEYEPGEIVLPCIEEPLQIHTNTSQLLQIHKNTCQPLSQYSSSSPHHNNMEHTELRSIIPCQLQFFKWYQGELDPSNMTCQEITRNYRLSIINGDVHRSKTFTAMYTSNPSLTNEFKAYCICFHSIMLMHRGKIMGAINNLKKALALLDTGDKLSDNSALVLGRIYRLFAKAYRIMKMYNKAKEYASLSRWYLINAVPSCEVACAHIEYAVILQRLCSVDQEDIQKAMQYGQYCTHQCRDIRQSYMIPIAYIEEAFLYLHIFDKLTHAEKLTPQRRMELKKAEELLELSKKYQTVNSIVYEAREKVAWAHI